MDALDNMGGVNPAVDPVGQNDGPAAEDSVAQNDGSPADMLRIKQQLSNHCFEMAVQLNAGKSERPSSSSEAERELWVGGIQMWHAIEEKMKQAGPDAEALKAVSDRAKALCSQIKMLQSENRTLQDEITEMQKKRLEIKRLIHEKMKVMEELRSNNEQPITDKYKTVLEKGQANLEKYKKITIMSQNVLRGILLAFKVNWLDNPKLREVVMTLEEFPISD
uniref:Centromere protein H n=1 Tax=Fundulus heteroclitus TaxID=8078 RepID=A0A3Q2P080_FUNHE